MLNCLRSTCLGTLFCLALMWPLSGVAGDYLPNFPLHVVPTPAYAMQELGVGITKPDCYYFHTPAQSPHNMDVQGQTIQYTLPLGIGVPGIGCTNAPSTFFVSIGSYPAGEYTVIINAYSLDQWWDGYREISRLQFSVLPNLALPQAQTIPSGGWETRFGLGALVLLLGCLALTGRYRYG